MAAVSCTGLVLRLGGRTVLDRVDLEIGDSEFVGVLGPNGAGKTTLFKAILGLLPAAAGVISVLGRTPTRGHPAVGYMPQLRSTPSTRLTGRAFVAAAAGGGRWGWPFVSRTEQRDVDYALDLVGAEALARRPLAETSGGERQRLLLAQALLGRPRLLLLDEPLVNLDPHRQEEVIELVRRLQCSLGITVLFSAHELNNLLPALDRVLYLGSGQAALGPVDQVMTSAVLSRLYGMDIEVIRLNGRVFVMSGGRPLEYAAHCHGLVA